MSWTTYTPAVADALEDAFAGVAFEQANVYAAHRPRNISAQYFLEPVQEEILALLQGRVSSKAYRKTWTCVSGLAVGDPVYISANDTVTKADATDSTKNQVIGYVRYKPTTTSCYLDHFVLATGLSGLTAGAEVFLTDAGGFSASAGTVRTVVGRANNATTASLFATATEGFGVSLTGTADTLAKFDGAGALEDSQLTDDGTDVIVKPAGFFAVEETGGGSDQLQFSHNGTDALIESTAGDIILEPFGGQLIVRQPGGTPGTHELLFYHDGSNGKIASQTGALQLAAPDGSVRLSLAASTSATFFVSILASGANARDIGNTSSEWRGLYLGEDASSGFFVGLDQNIRGYYDEAGSDIFKWTGGSGAADYGDMEWEHTLTITGAVSDGYVSSLRLDPGYTAATAQTVTRHNYLDLQNVSLAGAGPAALTDACIFRFDAAAGTHKAVDSATGSGTAGWAKANLNGTVVYWPLLSAKGTIGVTDHGALTGLSDDDHTIYALLAGRSTGQSLTGGTGSAEQLTLASTSHGTKGGVKIAASDWLLIPEVSAPSTPASGFGALYAKTDGKPYWKDDAGTEYDLTGGSGLTDQITVTFGDGATVIPTGIVARLSVEYGCTITGWTILSDQTGSIVVDVWKDTYANHPPTVADTIAGSEKPTLSGVSKNQDLSLSTWTTSVSQGDILYFNVDSVATVTQVTIVLRVTRS